jgi:excisionase family DNA binding protein
LTTSYKRGQFGSRATGANEVPVKQLSNERLLLRIDEVAALIGVSRTTAYALVNKGEIPSIRIGGMLRIPNDALRRLIEERAGDAHDK